MAVRIYWIRPFLLCYVTNLNDTFKWKSFYYVRGLVFVWENKNIILLLKYNVEWLHKH